jgi:hypothetical protein
MSNTNYTTQFSQEELKKEEWRSIVGWEGIYSVSNLGRIRRDRGGQRIKAGRILKPSLTHSGYLRVALFNPYVATCYIHTAVAISFIGSKPQGFEINHKDCIKTNNRPSNLEYISHAHNMKHAVINNCFSHRIHKTHCKRGHELTQENITKEGRRRCLICRKEYSKIWQRQFRKQQKLAPNL